VRLGTIRQFIKENVSDKVDVLITDDFSTYRFAVKGRPLERKHKTINHSAGRYVEGDIYTNTVESAYSLLKRGIIEWVFSDRNYQPAHEEEIESIPKQFQKL
jgi:hypothetical protein